MKAPFKGKCVDIKECEQTNLIGLRINYHQQVSIIDFKRLYLILQSNNVVARFLSISDL